jgi:transposase
VALNEGLRCKKRLWRVGGRGQLESFRLAPWASRRRHDLLELLDRLNPTIAELSQAVEREAENNPEAQRLNTHPGVGALTALAFVLIIGDLERFGGWHDFRHTLIRKMRKAGVHPVVVSGTVGHKRVELAPEVCDRANQNEIRDALSLVGKQLLPNLLPSAVGNC